MISGATKACPERARRSGMRRLWLSLLLVPVMVAAVALPISGAAWASPAAPAAPRARSAPAARTAPAAPARALQPRPNGSYHAVVFMRGWVHVPLGEIFNRVFFIGTAFAIHGDTDVPLAPVSHGCVRIPMDIANFFHKLVKIPGEPVYIR